MDIGFAGKRVLVTGTARGIGGAVVQGFAARVARMYAVMFLASEYAGFTSGRTLSVMGGP